MMLVINNDIAMLIIYNEIIGKIFLFIQALVLPVEMKDLLLKQGKVEEVEKWKFQKE